MLSINVLLLLVTLTAGALLPREHLTQSDIGVGENFNDPLAHYTLGDIEWSGFEGFDEDTVFRGTIENVIDQMRKIKGANFIPEFVQKAEANVEACSIQAGDEPPSNNLRMDCIRYDPSAALLIPIRTGIKYLSHLDDTIMCRNGAGPNNCGRISCSDTSGIWFCNENPVPSATFKCNIFAVYANNIAEDCWYDKGLAMLTQGQQYDDNYNISTLVRSEIYRC